jgi:archaellum component FlaC
MTNEDVLELIKQQFDQFGERIDQRFDGIDQRFDGIDQRLDGVDKRLGGVEKRLEAVELEARMAHIRIENLDTKIDHVLEGVIAVEQKVDRFRKETRENFDELQGRVTALEASRR